MTTTTPGTDGRDQFANRAIRRPPADPRRVLQIILTGIGLLVTTLVVFPQAQAERGGRKVSGFVVAAATQQPVPDAGVRYEETGRPPQTTVTDAKGYFELPSGRLGVVTVTARRFGTARRRWPPRRSSQLRFELAPPAVVSGSVTDMVTGRLLPAAVTVTVRHPENFVSHTVQARGGTFEIGDLPPGPGLVTARSKGFAPLLGSITVAAGREREARIGLLLEAQAIGRVVDGAGDPVVGAFVAVRYLGLGGGGILGSFVGGRRLTGSDGVFALDGLVPDTQIALQAQIDGRRSAAETITVAPGMRQLGVVLTLP